MVNSSSESTLTLILPSRISRNQDGLEKPNLMPVFQIVFCSIGTDPNNYMQLPDNHLIVGATQHSHISLIGRSVLPQANIDYLTKSHTHRYQIFPFRIFPVFIHQLWFAEVELEFEHCRISSYVSLLRRVTGRIHLDVTLLFIFSSQVRSFEEGCCNLDCSCSRTPLAAVAS